ncbi:diguanylate cyclase [Paracoccus sp. Z330]|uniref:diguanylate cyclase n=1 Tax=Paracoccus onchidii TaxID=3017813 RepID=A0ABT4ZC70_9RHOB|nr:diguanylate cyclase [Paracoccus onchidii]MDB6176954.1 diguanylate cyclase [Paracoccus onchidii]
MDRTQMTARILIADGTATTRITLKVRLTAACYDVCTVSNSDDLIRQAHLYRPDLIILGGGFAQTDPVAIAMSLMGEAELTSTPIIMLANAPTRLEALRAGVAAVLDPLIDEQMLLARIRGLLRDSGDMPDMQNSMAEPAAQFGAAPSITRVALVADNPARAMRWRGALQRRLASAFTICTPAEALVAAANGHAADLYLIAADIAERGDGLRLLSELRSRNGSKNAAFVVATEPHRTELSAIALDLGAGEVLPVDFDSATAIELAALALQSQLSRKEQGDRRRVETQRKLLWAMTDPLTGLYNRRYALPRLTEIAGEMKSCSQGFALLALDLDRFKSINDSYGHAAGDAVLVDLARRIERCIEDHGLAARIGGEEFLVILPSTTEAQAMQLAEDLRTAIQARPVRLPALSGGGNIAATSSIGVAMEEPCNGGFTAERIAEASLERADRALRQAKSRGRNCVVLAQPEHAG